MKAHEFPVYCEYFIDDYSKEIVDNYGHSKEVAIDLAKKDLLESFPNGIENTDHDLLCIEVEKNNELMVVGYLWHCKSKDENYTFIYDFYVADKYRGSGYGKQAINAFEVALKMEGILQIKLRVAYQNKRALKLYQATGFVITGYNMSKNIVV